MEAIKFDIQTDVRVKERSCIFFSRHVASIKKGKKKKIKKKKDRKGERRVKLSKITILFADEKKSIPFNFHINTRSLCSSRSVAWKC